MDTSNPLSQTVIEQQAQARAHLPFSDTRDFEDANRGLVVPIEEPVLAEDGTVIWDNAT